MTSATDYPWSSYRERMGGHVNEAHKMLDEDICYRNLGYLAEERRVRYQQFIEEGVPMKEKQWIAESVNRNQLTGNDRFIDEIEQRVGVRVARRGRGRPRKDEK